MRICIPSSLADIFPKQKKARYRFDDTLASELFICFRLCRERVELRRKRLRRPCPACAHSGARGGLSPGGAPLLCVSVCARQIGHTGRTGAAAAPHPSLGCVWISCLVFHWLRRIADERFRRIESMLVYKIFCPAPSPYRFPVRS